jgi:hypothetical protein
MLLRHRPPKLDDRPSSTAKGFEHLDQTWLALLRWLNDNRIDFVLVGAVAEAIRGSAAARGPVAIVPAPYHRNYERLARALWSAHARLRVDAGSAAGAETVPVKMTAEKLAGSERWLLRCGGHDLDIEPRPSDAGRYQELVYEAGRFELGDGLTVEVASPEDIEHYEHVRRTGTAPEIRITRNVSVERDAPQ